MTEYDLQTDKDRPYRDETILRRLYCKEYHTVSELADIFDCSAGTVSRWMGKFGIETRDRRVKYPKLEDKEWLQEKYHNENMSITEISELIDSSRMPVQRALKRHGIDAHSHGYKVKKQHPSFRLHSQGYVEVYSHYQYDDDGTQEVDWLRLHRLLAVAEYGFDAVANHEVHHKNNIPWDNRPGNIELLTKEEHALHHFTERGGLQEWQE